MAAAETSHAAAARSDAHKASASTAREDIGAAAAAAASLLSSPRHDLHSPRARAPKQQVELAVVGQGDIIGERTMRLGCESLSAHA